MHVRESLFVRQIVAAAAVAVGAWAPVVPGLGGAKAPYDTWEAERTFDFAFRTILDRALEPTTAAAIALEGLRGLASIDPEIGIDTENGRLHLGSASNLVAEYPLPGDNDVRAWARLTVTVALDARFLSDALRDADAERVYEAEFDAILGRQDLFSRYSGAREARELRANRNGFGGVGIRFELVDGDIRVTEVMEGSPAQRARIQEGDLITHIDGMPVSGLDREELSRRLRGPVDSRVSLGIRRGYKPMDLALRRDLIVPETVGQTYRDGIATFRVTGFNKSTADTMRQDLIELRRVHGTALVGVVLDLRGNPGGFLDQAVDMADLFIADGPIVSTRGRHPLANQAYDARPGDIGEDLPVAVVIDGKAASAAEIVAAALQDSGRAVIVGTNSYGKGTVQSLVELPNHGELHLTWSRFHAPSGYALHGLGVLPNLCTASLTAPAAALTGAAALAATSAPAAANLPAWRHVGIADVGKRTALRALCPADLPGDGDRDVALAQRVIADPALYGPLLALSAPLGERSAAQVPPNARPEGGGLRGN